ncbi:MAG: hypothetical protein LBD45_08070 [Bacteroidales bacterium]|jgi:predicted outer membrane repeat protein|nr:hypothetical protein [Bacteroidales bacterium]
MLLLNNLKLTKLCLFLMFSNIFLAKAETIPIKQGATSVEIQRIVDRAKPGDIIYFQGGSYHFNSAVTINKRVSFGRMAGDTATVRLVATGNFRHFVIADGEVRMENITFVGRDTGGGGVESFGQDSLIISSCSFLQNKSQYGGAIAFSGFLSVTKSVFQLNTATANGGAIDVRGKLTLSECLFMQNKAILSGGAVYNRTLSTGRNASKIVNCSFAQNESGQGGAIHSENSLEILSSRFFDNIARTGGGALFLTNTCTVSKTTLFGNRSFGKGGALYAQHTVEVWDCVFSQNLADDAGGGIFNELFAGQSDRGTFSIINTSVFSGNKGNNGGGIYTTFSAMITDCFFELNTSLTSGGGISGEKDLLLNRTTFDTNSALMEGGGIEARTARVINTTMIGNRSQNASAVHAQQEGIIVLSTFSGNIAALKSGSVIYGKTLTLLGNIILGDISEDKVAGKIKDSAYNLLGREQLANVFQMSGNEIMVESEPGMLPIVKIKTGGAAHRKIPGRHLQKWEKELGIIDFFNIDQLKGERSFFDNVDIGAVMAASYSRQGQIPVIDLQTMFDDIARKRIPEMTLPASAQTHSMNFPLVAIIEEPKETPKEEPVRKSPPSQPVSDLVVSSFDEALDLAIDAIITDSKKQPAPTQPASKQPAKTQTKKTQPSATKPTTPASADITITHSPDALAGTYTIDPTNPLGNRNFISIEDAVDALNSNGNTADTRFIISSGIYKIGRPIMINNADFPISFSNNPNDNGMVIIRSGGNNRVIMHAASSPLRMSRIIFEGPDADSQGRNVKGGGGVSCNTKAVLTFDGCIFRYNKNQSGGCILGKSVIVAGCSFYSNIASEGGVIYATECTAVNSTFYANRAAVGGSIYAKDKAIVALCTFTRNEANEKASAIYSPNVQLVGCIVSGNNAKSNFDAELIMDFTNVLDPNTKNIFAEVDDTGTARLSIDGKTPYVAVKRDGLAAERISESLLSQWEDELGLKDLLSIDQHSKHRPQFRNAEIGAWELPADN